MLLDPMRLGITGPVWLDPLREHLPVGVALPSTYSFPLVGQLAAELMRRGHEVTVFCGSYTVSSTEFFEGGKLRVWVVPLRVQRAPYDFYARERQLLRPLMRESGCDLIHAHWTYEFAASAQDSGLPVLVTAHDSPFAILRHFFLGAGRAVWTARALLAMKVIRQARYLTSVSPYCLEHIQRTLRPRSKSWVVANGIDEAWSEFGKGKKKLVEKEGDKSGTFRATTVLEGFSRRKNGQKALRAWAGVVMKNPDSRLTMLGTGYEDSGAGAWAREQGLAANVRFLGRKPQAEIQRILAEETDVLFHPSREESFGMAPLEAMALGVPVVGGRNAGGVAYVVGNAGLLVDVENIDEMAGALLSLARDPGMRMELGNNGRERAGKEFSFQRMVDHYESVYANISRDAGVAQDLSK
ncbi:MAG: glycosyltransferase family 4 protein [Blastochloris sp.]|nr:glycosyltransferase family 4 protein [Blastochloris sp.]